eukprot:966509-Amphidinium_carterae.1
MGAWTLLVLKKGYGGPGPSSLVSVQGCVADIVLEGAWNSGPAEDVVEAEEVEEEVGDVVGDDFVEEDTIVDDSLNPQHPNLLSQAQRLMVLRLVYGT